MFFFEKKNHKTFGLLAILLNGPKPKFIKVFLLPRVPMTAPQSGEV